MQQNKSRYEIVILFLLLEQCKLNGVLVLSLKFGGKSQTLFHHLEPLLFGCMSFGLGEFATNHLDLVSLQGSVAARCGCISGVVPLQCEGEQTYFAIFLFFWGGGPPKQFS